MKNNRIRLLLPFISLVAGIAASSALGLGTEDFGNASLNERYYQEWPNLVHVLDDMNRVYSVWINGAEKFYFRGSTESLNESLARFAAVQVDVREVVLIPGPAPVTSLLGGKTFDYDWCVKLHGGLSEFLTRRKGALIWNKCPMFVVLIGGGNIQLEKIRIPEGVTVLEASNLRKRYTEAIRESDDVHVKGWGAGELARVDPFSAESVSTIAKLLEDPDEWVRLDAAGALAVFGKNAAPAIPSLRQASETTNTNLKATAESAISAIEAATTDSTGAKLRSDTLQKIHLFKESLLQRK